MTDRLPGLSNDDAYEIAAWPEDPCPTDVGMDRVSELSDSMLTATLREVTMERDELRAEIEVYKEAERNGSPPPVRIQLAAVMDEAAELRAEVERVEGELRLSRDQARAMEQARDRMRPVVEAVRQAVSTVGVPREVWYALTAYDEGAQNA